MMKNSRPQYKSTYLLFDIVLASMIFGLMVAPSQGWAGGWGRCHEPTVFRGSAVNVIILPYTYTGEIIGKISDKQFSKTGEKLSALIQLDSLLSMVKYNSIGVIYLSPGIGSLEECQPERVLEKILWRKDRRDQQILPGNGVAMLWGRIYEEGDDIYTQSYMLFLRRDTPERFRISLSPYEGLSLGFAGELPSQSFAFAPRRITINDLQDIEREFQRSILLRPTPDESAAAAPIGQFPQFNLNIEPRSPETDHFAYYVTETKGDWMHIVFKPSEMGSGPRASSGWVKARIDPIAMPLRQKLPELDFLDAVVGYLQYQIAHETVSKEEYRRSIVGWVKKALDRYQKNSGAEQAALPTAVGKILQGTLEIVESDPKFRATTMDIVRNLYAQASSLIPYSVDAKNLELLTRITLWHEAKSPKTDPKPILADLLEAVTLDPRNQDVLANLENFLVLLKSYDVSSTSLKPEELERQINAVRNVRSALKTVPGQ